jgi:hypothetical protein
MLAESDLDLHRTVVTIEHGEPRTVVLADVLDLYLALRPQRYRSIGGNHPGEQCDQDDPENRAGRMLWWPQCFMSISLPVGLGEDVPTAAGLPSPIGAQAGCFAAAATGMLVRLLIHGSIQSPLCRQKGDHVRVLGKVASGGRFRCAAMDRCSDGAIPSRPSQ